MAAVIPPWSGKLQETLQTLHPENHPLIHESIQKVETRVEKLETATNAVNVSVGKICVKIDAIQDRLDRSLNWRDILLFAGIIASAVIGVVL